LKLAAPRHTASLQVPYCFSPCMPRPLRDRHSHRHGEPPGWVGPPGPDVRVTVGQVFVMTPGTHDGTLTVHVALTGPGSVASLKTAIAARLGVPCEKQWLSYGGAPLHDDTSLREQGVHDSSTLQLSFRGKGGARGTTWKLSLKAHPHSLTTERCVCLWWRWWCVCSWGGGCVPAPTGHTVTPRMSCGRAT
jgi:hypothetical protein